MLRAKALYAFVVITFMLSFLNLAIADSGTDQEFFSQDSAAQNAADQGASNQNTSQSETLIHDTLKQSAATIDAKATDPVVKKITVQDDPVQSAPAQKPATQAPAGVSESKDTLVIDQPVTVAELKKMDIPSVETPLVIDQLKKIDPNKIGADASYTTFGGFRPVDYIMKNPALGVGQRVEIYQEPKPIDAYMIMAKEMQYVWSDYYGWRQNSVQQTPANLRSVIVPLFVRSYGTEFTLSDPDESTHDIRGQIRYTIDYRDVYREYYPKYPDLKAENWLQQDVMFISTVKIKPLDWLYTSNLGYRFSNVDQKSFDVRWNFGSAQQVRSTYYTNQSIVFNPRFEIFGQGEYYKSSYYHNDWAYSPDHYFIAGELRLKSKDMKTSYTGRFAYTKDIYSPFSNSFEKYEIWARVGHDFNNKLNAYSMLKYVSDYTSSKDNAWWAAPPGVSIPMGAPFNVQALALTWESRVQYRIYDKLWVQGGFDLANGINMSDFDNVGWLGGLEYYAPGIIRVDVGWRGNQYYNIDDFLSTIYFKCYLFM